MHTTLVTTVLRHRQRRRTPRSTAIGAILAALALVASIAPAAAAGPGDPGGEPNEVDCELEIGVTEHCPRWSHQFDPGAGLDQGTIALSPDGEVAFHGFGVSPNTSGKTGDSELVARRSDSGSTLWSVHPELPPTVLPSDATALTVYEIAVSPDSRRVYVVGAAHSGDGEWCCVTSAVFAFDAGTGEQLWATTAPETPVVQAESGIYSLMTAVAVSPDGRHVYVGGSRKSVTGPPDVGGAVVWNKAQAEVLSLAADTGQVEWRHRPDPRNAPVGSWGLVRDLVVSPDGSIYARARWITRVVAAAREVQRFSEGFFVVAYDSTGSQVWQYTPEPVPAPRLLDDIFGRSDQGGNEIPMSLSPDGRRLIVTLGNVAYSGPIRVLALDTAAGQLEWMRTHKDISNCAMQGTMLLGGAVVSPDGQRVYWAAAGCLGTGNNYGAANHSIAVVAYQAATGKPIWIARDEPAEGTWSMSHYLAVSADGSQIYLVGSTGTDYTMQPVTMAFDAAAGNELWRTDFGSRSGMGLPRKIIASPDGDHVYAYLPTTGRNVHTVAVFDTREGAVSLTGTASPEQAAVGEPLTLSFAVANAGPAAAEDATLTVRLDNRLVSFTTEESGSCTDEFGIGNVTCELGAVGSGETATIRIVVTPKAAGTAVTSASVRGAAFDPSPDDNRVVIDTQIGAP